MIDFITKKLPAVLVLLITLLITISLSDAAEKKILIIGDSHSVGVYGQELDRQFRSHANFTVETYATCGSIAQWFFTGKSTQCGFLFKDQNGATLSGNSANTPLVSNAINRFKPDLIMIELGGNYWGYSSTFARADMLKLANLIRENDIPCFWAGAPDSRKKPAADQQRIYDDLENSVTHACQLFDSRTVTKYPATGGDGIHYWGAEGSAQAKKWAKAVYNEAVRTLVSP